MIQHILYNSSYIQQERENFLLSAHSVLQTENRALQSCTLISKMPTQISLCSTSKAHTVSQSGCQCPVWKRREHLQVTYSKCERSEQWHNQHWNPHSLISVGLQCSTASLSNYQPIPSLRRQISPPSCSVFGH